MTKLESLQDIKDTAPRGWLPSPQVLSFRAASRHLTLRSRQVESRFLPEIEFSKSTRQIEDFNPKSIKIKGNCQKSLQFQK